MDRTTLDAPFREITDHKVNGLNEALTIRVHDEPGPGGSNHDYSIYRGGNRTRIRFQKGPIKEAGVNGISNEALLAIVMDRLVGFQSGEFGNEDNAQALEHLKLALDALHKRIKDRIARGVEGTMKE